MFPNIEHLNDLLPHIRNKPEISIKKHDNGCTVVCYAISDSNTFSDVYAKECRGITFGPDDKILSRSLHKFFNVNEREDTLVHNINWSDAYRLMDKRDGSMITSMMLNNKIVCKTKKSFDTLQAIKANDYIHSKLNYYDFAVYCATLDYTPIYEWTSPLDRIVLKYEQPELVLLHIRENISGKYIKDISYHADIFNIPVVNHERLNMFPTSFDIGELMSKCKDEILKEGYIIQFRNGDMVKLKTPWYLDLHHVVTFTRERDIAQMTIDEKLDDFKSYLVGIGESLDKVLSIETRVSSTMKNLKKEVEDFVDENKNLNRKDFAGIAQKHKYFGLIMSCYLDMIPKYNEYFIKYLLKEYSLDVV